MTRPSDYFEIPTRSEAEFIGFLLALPEHARSHLWQAELPPMHLACIYDFPRAVRLLLDWGDDPLKPNCRDNSPLRLCAINGSAQAALEIAPFYPDDDLKRSLDSSLGFARVDRDDAKLLARHESFAHAMRLSMARAIGREIASATHAPSAPMRNAPCI